MTKRFLTTIFSAALLMQGCTTPLGPADDSVAMTESDATSDNAQEKAPELPYRPFTAETLYALLVAEMAGSRERYDIALGNYIQQAHKTRDPGIAARATRIARYLNARQAALNTALLWVEIAPEDREARYIAAGELTQNGRLLEAVEHSNYLLEHDSTTLYQPIAARASQSTDTQREQLLSTYEALLEQHPDNTDLLVGLGLIHQQQNNLNDALVLSRRALDIDNTLVPAAVLETKILVQQEKPDEALKRLAQLLEQNPDNTRLRLQYARLLASTDLPKAREEFETLVAKTPNDAEMLFSLALICNELNQLDDAERYFTELTTFEDRRSSGHYYLGRIAEKRQQWDQALQHYMQVEPGPDFMPALVQTTDLLVRGGQEAAAHKRLEAARERFPSQSERLYLLEAEVLGKHLQLVNAQQVLSQGLEQFPASIPLLYSRAMINEQLDQLSALEVDLRTILKYDPNNATALNALGYTLADRTDRHQEAYELIAQALQLKPDDPAIIDSMGWVQYRLGNYKEAILRLQEAMKAFPDHEIAAHLGEVLWVTGNRDEAEKVWQEGIQLQPEGRAIPAVMERLKSDMDTPKVTNTGQ